MSQNTSVSMRGRMLLVLAVSGALLASLMAVTTGTAHAQMEYMESMESAPNNFWTSLAGTAACIESDTVQNDPTAAGLSLGQTFVGGEGNRFTITNGGPLCSFTGAGCDPYLHLHVVSHVKQCLAAQATTPATLPVVDAVPVTTLAHTGSDQVLGILGATMLGAGALLEAGRRRRAES